MALKILQSLKKEPPSIKHMITHQSWESMMRRCYSKTHADYPAYGGKGVVVSQELHDFDSFVAYVGLRPSRAHTLDRKDNSKGYLLGNLRWATRKEQANNRSSNRWITFNGFSKTLAQWSEHLSITPASLRKRLASWPIEKALTSIGRQSKWL